MCDRRGYRKRGNIRGDIEKRREEKECVNCVLDVCMRVYNMRSPAKGFHENYYLHTHVLLNGYICQKKSCKKEIGSENFLKKN